MIAVTALSLALDIYRLPEGRGRAGSGHNVRLNQDKSRTYKISLLDYIEGPFGITCCLGFPGPCSAAQGSTPGADRLLLLKAARCIFSVWCPALENWRPVGARGGAERLLPGQVELKEGQVTLREGGRGEGRGCTGVLPAEVLCTYECSGVCPTVFTRTRSIAHHSAVCMYVPLPFSCNIVS